MSFLKVKEQRNALIAALFLMFGYGIFNYTPGYFMGAVAEELNCSHMLFSMQSSIVSVTAVLTAPFFGKHITNMKNIKRMMCAGAALGAVCYIITARIQSIYGLYTAALVFGLVANNCTMVCAVAILEKAFHTNSGTPTGIVMSGSGLCGAIISTFLPGLLASQGWRNGYVFVAGMWLAVFLIAGIAASKVKCEQRFEDDSKEAGALRGATYQQAIRSPVLYLFAAVVLIVCINMVFLQHMPAFYAELGKTPATAGRFVSLFSIVLAASKIVVGTLHDKLGARKTTLLCAAAFAVGMWMQLVSTNTFVLVLGIVISTFGHTLCNVLLPLLTKHIFGSREYAAIWSFFSGCVMLGYAVGSPIWGGVYDLAGSYKPAVALFPVSILLCAAVIVYLISPKNKVNWESRRQTDDART